MTPTGLPIEHHMWESRLHESFDLPFNETSPGEWEGIIDTSFQNSLIGTSQAITNRG